MRAKITLEVDEVVLPYNYNYHLSSAIYSALEEADSGISEHT